MCRLKEFRLFVAAFEEASFSAAARRENATQSGVSQHIQRMEESLKVRLFHRRGKRVVPTPAGEAYYRHCVELLRFHADALRDLQRFRGEEGELRVGVTPWIARHVVPAALDSFVSVYPNVSLIIIEDENHSLAERVKRGEFSFVVMPETDLAENPTVLLESPAYLAYGRSRQADLPDVELPGQLSRVKLVMSSSWSRWRKVVDRYLADNSCEPRQAIEITSLSAAIKVLTNSDWCSILPGLIVSADSDRDLVAMKLLPDAPVFRIMSVCANRPLSEAGKTFHAMLADEITALGQRGFGVPVIAERARGRPTTKVVAPARRAAKRVAGDAAVIRPKHPA
ncbi:DNA-binding transcriptional LysR family regulator [Hyphomicrobiales bacterium]|nr:DNA-binding transcriptional LysR family regulator [Hyphomicrobiales bacterium]CAH1673228.1 DNA-binding transcriptional LysR family regulator [Hyphomicrobiales bacterium]